MKFLENLFKNHIVRYVISGGTATAVNLAVLFILTHFAGLHYLASGIIAFCVAVAISFLLQKKWTFQDYSTENAHKQFIIFVIVGIFNLGLNTLLLYLFTDIAHLYYLVSQILASGFVAFSSYFIYKVVFRNRAR